MFQSVGPLLIVFSIKLVVGTLIYEILSLSLSLSLSVSLSLSLSVSSEYISFEYFIRNCVWK